MTMRIISRIRWINWKSDTRVRARAFPCSRAQNMSLFTTSRLGRRHCSPELYAETQHGQGNYIQNTL